MELRQLEYFQKVCRLNNITKAAEELHVSQPSVSTAIQRLEHELGVNLLDRSKKQIRLTEEGSFFLQRVEDILSRIADTVCEMNDYKEIKKRNLKLGIPPMIGTFLFPHIFGSFKQLHPDINLIITENGSVTIREMIEDGEIDLGIVIISEASPFLETIPILESEIVVCLNSNHPFCSRETLTFEDLRHEPIIMLKEGFYNRDEILAKFKSLNIEPNIILSSNQLETIKSLLISGAGISFLFKEIIRQDENISTVPLSNRIYEPIGLAWKKDRYLPYAGKVFIDFIVEKYRVKAISC